jgi:hypothetical protein
MVAIKANESPFSSNFHEVLMTHNEISRKPTLGTFTASLLGTQ